MRKARKATRRGPSPRRSAYERLIQFHTHDFVKVRDVELIARGFGIPLYPESVRANTGVPKGLEMAGKRRNEMVRGVSIYQFSAQIADSLPDLPEGTEIEGQFTEKDGERDYNTKLGRGSMARSAWAYIDAVLRKEGE